MYKDLSSYILIADKVISEQVCEETVSELKISKWEKHQYFSNLTNERISSESDFSVTGIAPTHHEILMSGIENVLRYYIDNLKFDWFNAITAFSGIRYNKYEENTLMNEHWDGIQSLFDGKRKGIPTLSVLGSLNNDYEGGELIFFKDERIVLKQGSVMIFPSSFMYPHKVQSVKKGTRYSFVSWAY